MFYFCCMDCEMPDVKHKQVINFLVDDRYRWARHACLLLGFGALLYISGFPDQFPGVYKFYSICSVFIVYISMFYINMYVLVPAFFFRARYVLYLLLVILLVLCARLRLEVQLRSRLLITSAVIPSSIPLLFILPPLA